MNGYNDITIFSGKEALADVRKYEDAVLWASAPDMYAALKAVEWKEVYISINEAYNECPCCGNNQVNGHKPDCQLASALKKAEGV
jgi:hypothetical protein